MKSHSLAEFNTPQVHWFISACFLWCSSLDRKLICPSFFSVVITQGWLSHSYPVFRLLFQRCKLCIWDSCTACVFLLHMPSRWCCLFNIHLQMDLESKALMPSHGGDRLSYQQDPRPHFGVARSSRSTSFPLWDREGHSEIKREADEDDMNSISNCPHCHLGLPLDTLRWHAVNTRTLFKGNFDLE